MDNHTLLAALESAISALRAIDTPAAALTPDAAADVAEAIVSLEREAGRISDAIDEPDYDGDPRRWEDAAA